MEMIKDYEPCARVSFILYKVKKGKQTLIQGCGEKSALLELCKLRNINVSKCVNVYKSGVYYLELNERGK